MKVLLVIDHLGPGGAQRQIVELACGLKKRGHKVEMFVYFPQHDFFRSRVEEQQIVVHEYSKVRRFSFRVVFRLASVIRQGGYDVAVSYLNSANAYTELVKMIFGGAALVVSERTSCHDDKFQRAVFARRILHVFADHVVANSVTHCAWLKQKWWLKNKVSCIYNGIDVDKFHPSPSTPTAPQELRLIGIGRIGPEKNILGLIEALALFRDECGYVPEISWAGRRDESPAGRVYGNHIDELLASMPDIRNRWHWLGVQSDIPGLLQQHHALIHPSSYEGLPNVVCEALASGTPVLVSDVCDHPLLVAAGERGFLFNQNQPASIASAIGRLDQLDQDGWCKLSNNAREYAVANLGAERMVLAYEKLFSELVEGFADGNAQREQY